MIRNVVFGLSFLALSTGAAFAAPVHHAGKARVVAEATAPAADATAPAGDKVEKKSKKSAKKGHSGKTTEGAAAKEIKAPASTAPAPETK